MKKGILVLLKFVKREEKIAFLLVFVCFLFTEISYFMNFPSNENVRKQHLSVNAYFCVNMKFSYTIAVMMKFSMSFCYENQRFFTCVQVNFSLTIFKRKDKICYVVLQPKQAIGQLLLKMFIFFLLILVGNVIEESRISSLLFSFMVVNASSLYLMKTCSQKLGY